MQEEAAGRKMTFKGVRRAMSTRFQRRENAGEVYDLLKILKQKKDESLQTHKKQGQNRILRKRDNTLVIIRKIMRKVITP